MEHSSFTPLVSTTSSGMGHEANVFYKQLATLLAEKWKDPYSAVLGWIRFKLSFCLLRSAIQCIRGARSSQGHCINSAPVALVQSETQFLIFICVLFFLFLVKEVDCSASLIRSHPLESSTRLKVIK